MASAHNNYESSSDDEDDESLAGSHSTAFLGFVDAPITEDDRPTIEDSFIGGSPIWFDESSPAPSELLHCKVCNSPMALLSQSFAPYNDSLYDRIIYVFSCKNAGCRRQKGSIRAIRAIHKDPAKMSKLQAEKDQHLQRDFESKLKLEEQKKLDLEVTKNLFDNSSSTNENSNPFSSASVSNPFASNPFSKPSTSKPAEDTNNEVKSKPTFASVAAKAAKDNKTEGKALKPENVKLKEFPGSFIYVEEEKLKAKKSNDVKMTSKIEELDSSVLDTEFDESEQTSSKSKSSPENPEAARIASMMEDPVFGKFSEIISYNSQQVLRYDLGGIPLLYSSKDDIYKLFINEDKQLKIPNPGYNPSSTRQFEFQLMPKMILDLEKDNSDILNGMEWGTIIVCTDVEDYIPKFDDNNVGYVEEWCGVQWEEEVKR